MKLTFAFTYATMVWVTLFANAKATVVQGGSVVEGTAAENSERALKSTKGTIAPGVPLKSQKKIKSSKKIKSAFKKTKEGKSVKKKKSKKAKGTAVPSNAPSQSPSSASVLTSNPTAVPSQSPSIRPVEPFGPVEAFVAVPTGTNVAVVSAAVETASIDTILQNPVRRKLQEASEVGSTELESAILDSIPESVHRMLQVNTIGSIQVTVVPTPCDCVLVSGLIFQTSDACDCYDCFISGTVGFPNRAVIILTGSISNGTFGLRINQIIPGSNAQGSPFATSSPSSIPTIATASPSSNPTIPTSAPTESSFPSFSPMSSPTIPTDAPTDSSFPSSSPMSSF